MLVFLNKISVLWFQFCNRIYPAAIMLLYSVILSRTFDVIMKDMGRPHMSLLTDNARSTQVRMKDYDSTLLLIFFFALCIFSMSFNIYLQYYIRGKQFVVGFWNYQIKSFIYTRCNTPKRVTSLRAHLRVSIAPGQHSSFRRNVAAVASRWQHCVRFDRP